MIEVCIELRNCKQVGIQPMSLRLLGDSGYSGTASSAWSDTME
jgi:hypothetical protein